MDKETALLISEMLIKQDETTTQIKETNKRIEETNTVLKEFMGVSVKQWDQQQKFNERFFDKLENIEKGIDKLSSLEERIKHLESLEERLIKVENLLKASFCLIQGQD